MIAPPVMETCACSPTQMAPPKPVIVFVVLLLLNVLLLICATASALFMNIAPALPPVLFFKVLLLMFTGPELKIAPPL